VKGKGILKTSSSTRKKVERPINFYDTQSHSSPEKASNLLSPLPFPHQALCFDRRLYCETIVFLTMLLNYGSPSITPGLKNLVKWRNKAQRE
jgi:hypothetical protein